MVARPSLLQTTVSLSVTCHASGTAWTRATRQSRHQVPNVWTRATRQSRHLVGPTSHDRMRMASLTRSNSKKATAQTVPYPAHHLAQLRPPSSIAIGVESRSRFRIGRATCGSTPQISQSSVALFAMNVEKVLTAARTSRVTVLGNIVRTWLPSMRVRDPDA